MKQIKQIINCQECNQPYFLHKKIKSFCSFKCRKLNGLKNTWIMFNCAYCNTVTTKRKVAIKLGSLCFCSVKCQHESQPGVLSSERKSNFNYQNNVRPLADDIIQQEMNKFYKNGFKSKLGKPPSNKLVIDPVLTNDVSELYVTKKYTMYELSDKFNVSYKTICRIVHENLFDKNIMVSKNKIKDTKIENKLKLLFIGTKNEIIYNKKIGNYIPDIRIENKKIIIEAFGDYYHCNPLLYDATFFNRTTGKTSEQMWEHDRIKLAQYKQLGYIPYVFWEYDIINNWNNVAEQIESILK